MNLSRSVRIGLVLLLIAVLPVLWIGFKIAVVKTAQSAVGDMGPNGNAATAKAFSATIEAVEESVF